MDEWSKGKRNADGARREVRAIVQTCLRSLLGVVERKEDGWSVGELRQNTPVGGARTSLFDWSHAVGLSPSPRPHISSYAAGLPL